MEGNVSQRKFDSEFKKEAVRKAVRTTNAIERRFREVKRRNETYGSIQR